MRRIGKDWELELRQGMEDAHSCSKPEYPDNMELKVNSTIKLKLLNANGVPFEDNPYFLHGDIITLDCKDGYVLEGTVEREYENNQAYSNSYYNYEDRDEVNNVRCNFGVRLIERFRAGILVEGRVNRGHSGSAAERPPIGVTVLNYRSENC
ncbi:hypothetical protein DPMN_152490 [Dreissena polymorpha]|uniref:Uncharacterized protein n=1 Tax=Dreissena polymorpha TaxID=45954 RepID=A0A9D4FN41_DREPO|nr:hypothetical protein DPMN_152490 [Dreissena polymorpha]